MPRPSRTATRKLLEPLLRQMKAYELSDTLMPAVLDRASPHVVIGTADLGALFWCEAKGTFKQAEMEPNFASRALMIFEANARAPRFARPHPTVCALEVDRPGDDEADEPDEPAWALAEREETRGAWRLAFVSLLSSATLSITPAIDIVLVGVTDGVREDGTVVEVRQTGWTWASLLDSGEVSAKQTQANLYAVMLGLPRWACVFRCRDGRHETTGEADEGAALAAVARGVRFRAALANPSGVPRNRRSRCAPQSGRNCEYLGACPYTPIRR